MHMPRQQQRNARLFCIFSLVFCTAAIAAGICFVYAVQMGLETLALYQPLAAGSTGLEYFPQGHFSRASLTRLELSNPGLRVQPYSGQQIIKQGDDATQPEQDAFLPIDTSRYNLRPQLPRTQQLLPWARAQGKSGASAHTSPLSRNDFVSAFLTDQWHTRLAQSSRLWRQGLRTFVATNYEVPQNESEQYAAMNETWGYYPDDKPLHTLALKGDSRAALTPFLAHSHFGDTYKWLLYGDDDTFFFLDVAMNVLQHLDPDMPYFITDHMWWTGKSWDPIHERENSDTHHPHQAAPLCTPCNYAKNTSDLPFPAPSGCPCIPELLCAADNKGVLFKGARGKCGQPRVPTHTYSMHGGAGAILSVGLLRAIPLEWFEDCVTTTYSTGGDAIISVCLWSAGYGMTAPDPLWHPRNLTMFDVGRIAQRDDEDIAPKIAHAMGNMLQAVAGGCRGGFCKLELEHMMTLHLRSRKFPSIAAFVETVRVLAALYDRVVGRQSPALQQAGDPFIDELVELGIQALEERQWLGAERPSNASTSQLAEIVSTIRTEAEAKAASAVASEIISAIFKRLPTDDPPPTDAHGSEDDAVQLEEEQQKILDAALQPETGDQDGKA